MPFDRLRRSAARIDGSDPTHPVITMRGEVHPDNAHRVADVLVNALAPPVVEVELDVRHLAYFGADAAYAVFRLLHAAREHRPPVRITVTGAGARTRADMRRLGLDTLGVQSPDF